MRARYFALLAARAPVHSGTGGGRRDDRGPECRALDAQGPDAIRGIAAISMVESLVPAAGPVFGAALLVYLSWRGTFWILAGAALIVLPIVAKITPRELPGLDHAHLRGIPLERYTVKGRWRKDSRHHDCQGQRQSRSTALFSGRTGADKPP